MKTDLDALFINSIIDSNKIELLLLLNLSWYFFNIVTPDLVPVMIVLPSRDERTDCLDCDNYHLQNSLSDR